MDSLRFDELLSLCDGDRDKARAIEALFERTSRDLLELFEESPAYLTIVEGPEFRVVMNNRRVRESFPYGPFMVGKRLEDFYPGRTPVRDVLERVYATGIAETMDEGPAFFRGPPQDRYFTRRFVPLRPGHDGAKRILIIVDEVTDAVHARMSSQAEQQRLYALLEDAPVIMTVLEGPELRVAMMNQLSRAYAQGRFTVGDSIRDRFGDTLTITTALRVLATGIPETYETIARDVEGYIGRAFALSVVPIRDRDGRITSVLTTSHEVTEQRRAREMLETQARDLEAARREAVEASRAKDEFLAMLGHELRNPLSPMMTTLEVMRMRGETSPEIDLLWRQVQHLTRLVGDLLDVSRITRGKVELRRSYIPLATVVNRALEVASPLIEQQRNRVITELSPVTVHGDADRLVQVVTNLVTNAAKFSAPASTIRIALERRDGRARIAVADEGIGIAPDMLGRVFDAFVQQPRSATRHGGLGLGLTIARSLVTAHGGVISATSDGPGHGSTFVIELPAIDVEYRDADIAPARPKPARSTARVLVVDDNRDAAVALKGALERLGYAVAVAFDAATAIREAASLAPHIGLLDLGLPDADGYALAATLREQHDLRIAAITGYGQPSDYERTRAAGFDAHLVKPVDLDQLAQLLERFAPRN